MFSQLKFQGHIFFENHKTKPLENVRVSIWSNKSTRTSTSDINGNFQINLASNFSHPFYLLYYKVGFYTRVYYLTDYSLSQDIGMKIVFIPQDSSLINTTFICGRLIQSNLTPVPFVEVFGDYGERPVVSDDRGNFKLPISKSMKKNETYLWFEKEGFNPVIHQISNFEKYDENNPLLITLEPLPSSFYFDFTVQRSDTEKPIENVEIEIDGESVGRTNEQGRFLINKRFDRDKLSVNAKFHHKIFPDTSLSVILNNYKIVKNLKLRPPLFKINTMVYYESTHQTMQGIPDVEVSIGEKLLNRTNSSGQCDLNFRALPGDELSIRFPENKRYFPIDTSIILNRGQNSFNIRAIREPVKISLIAIDSLGNEKTSEINNFQAILNNYLLRTHKHANKFELSTNLFDPADELRVILASQKYESIGEAIKLNQISENVYEGKFHVKPKEERYVVEDIKSVPGEGILILDSEPKEAKIYIDHVEGNYTPDTLKLFEGIHTIELKKDGFLSAPIVVEIKPDSTIYQNIKLVGPITPLEKTSNWLKISTDLSVLGLLMEYPSGNIYPFPTFRIGGHFYALYNSNCGLRISYLASKIPTYYTSQEFGLGLFLGKGRVHWLIGFKESNFESFKEIESRFAGSSVESNLTISIDSENRAKENLLFLNKHSLAMIFGYERSFDAMNKSVAGQFENEQEYYGGFLFRWNRGILNLRLGVIHPKLTVVDIENEKKPKNVNIRLYRLFLNYNYFLN